LAAGLLCGHLKWLFAVAVLQSTYAVCSTLGLDACYLYWLYVFHFLGAELLFHAKNNSYSEKPHRFVVVILFLIDTRYCIYNIEQCDVFIIYYITEKSRYLAHLPPPKLITAVGENI
jgi:hypothetical protein